MNWMDLLPPAWIGTFVGSKPGISGPRNLCARVVMDFGPGYRLYYGVEGKTIIILLGGGSKRSQQRDIGAAVERWQRYRNQMNRGGI